MKVKHTLKKYKFLSGNYLSNQSHYLSRRTKSIFSNTELDQIGPLEVGKLSFPVNWDDFVDYTELNVEIGTGHGELLEYLSRSDDHLVVGFEITKTYTLKTEKLIKKRGNAFVYKGDGYFYALNLFKDSSIDKIYILFPDPWHKKKHHKRRPIKMDWLIKVRKKLKPNGNIFFATDWMEYFEYVEDQINMMNSKIAYYTVKKGDYSPKGSGLISTHYYEKWLEAGRSFKYIQLTKTSHSAM